MAWWAKWLSDKLYKWIDDKWAKKTVTLADDRFLILSQRNTDRIIDYTIGKTKMTRNELILKGLIDTAEFGAEFIKSPVYKKVLEAIKSIEPDAV